MKKLTEKEILNILQKNLLNTCNEQEKEQVFKYAFGEEFMISKDKGAIKEYEEKKDFDYKKI